MRRPGVLRNHFRRSVVAVAAALGVTLLPARAAQTEVDLALVIAVDISYSMDTEEQALQREGFAQAFRARSVIDAIRRGAAGRIAVAYIEWAGTGDQRIVVPWTVLEGEETILPFADRIAAQPLRRAQRTSISGAIDFAARYLGESGVEATRRVIDVSGDGANNHGRPVTAAREAALRAGITINGLPIMLKAPGYFDIEGLDAYYRDCVIGGPGAFLIPARDKAQFQDAIRSKIVREVAALPGEARVTPVQATTPTDCLAGEKQWQDRMRN